MAYDEKLAARVRQNFPPQTKFSERKMFGGLSFLVDGKMCCGIIGNDLVIQTGPDHHDDALAKPHTRPMDFTGRPMKGFVYVSPTGVKTDMMLMKWLKCGLDGAASKKKKAPRQVRQVR